MRVTAATTVLSELRRAIASGELAPGTQLVQESLAEKFGVSRVPLREALQVLEGEGQVVHEPHRGYFVVELSVPDLVEVYRIRAVLEAEAARMALANLTDDELAALETLEKAIRAAARDGDVAAMIEANREFHFALFDLAHMPRLSRIVAALWDSTDVYRAVYYGSTPNRERVNDEHERILAALRNRDADALISELDGHRDHAVRDIATLVG